MPRFAALFLAAALASAAPVAATPSDDFRQLLDDHYAWLLRESPTYATSLGVRDYDDRIEDLSLAAADRRAAEAQVFLKRLDAIGEAGLTPGERTSRAILRRALAESIEANRFGQRQMLFTTYAGWHQNFAGLASGLPFRTKADYESYLKRLELYPAMNDEALKITAQAVRGGYVLPCSVLGNSEKSITGVIAEDPAQSRFYEPFAGARPADASEAEWQALQSRAQRVIRDVLNPAYAKHAAFYRASYAPKCAKSDSISAQPGGRDYYAFRVRQETTTSLTPDQIHAIGLRESARINAEMEKVAKEAGFASRAAFIEDLRTNPAHYAKSPEELLRASARVAKTIDGKMPGLFRTLPRLPYGIREIPPETAEGTTTAYYGQGAPESGLAGTYYVNTSKLDQRPFWEIPALTLHEAVPGHHHQIALQQEIDLPPFRRHFTFFTAFTEGWGLYAESLGEEMGLYDTPARKMGQLSYQAWRAARLVVDTGIHAKGWDKARAVAYMRENTALSAANIDAEVNRYISWPGQALGYKIGELKIRELRKRAETALGPKFDLRRFHDAVLLQGSVPLDVLEAQVDAWIAAEKG
ncbi:DUF885 family protein [Sphingosinicella sp. BN140058]|uniref:DUF885 domain-containing protein n=1 Tax=Sphingosinicella sp. BN140058 TaxID=1892855 RepID=UPI0010128FF3|nr:DUF885 domain-containing protein [Sphingosinicella sp. BN140058]QAY75662.1 DUF885 domain-containing protein [Sphingosinicella sp. BN140058]